MKQNLNNANELINLPAVVDSKLVPLVANKLNASFITQEQQVEAALNAVGIENIAHILLSMGDFFRKNVSMKGLTLETAKKLDHGTLVYAFLKENNIRKPLFNTPQEKAAALEIYFQLGRAYLHGFVIPELKKKKPNLAYAYLSEIKRLVRAVAIDQGINPSHVLDLLMLNEVVIELPLTSVSTQHGTNKFLMPGIISKPQINKIGIALKDKFKAIPNSFEFTKMVTSGGKPYEPMKVHAEHLKLVAYVFYRLLTPYDKKNHYPLLDMSIGKGFWKFIELGLVDASTGALCTSEDQLKKINSATMASVKDKHIIEKVDQLIMPIYKAHYKLA